MTYVYLLSEYDEGGSDIVAATLDRRRVLALFNECFPPLPHWSGDEERRTLAELLERDDSALAGGRGFDLARGWGGCELHVVKLR